MVVNGDLNEILAMRQDLDAYHLAFANIITYLRGEYSKGFVPAIIKGVASSEDVEEEICCILDASKDLRKKYDELDAKYKQLHELYVEAINLKNVR